MFTTKTQSSQSKSLDIMSKREVIEFLKILYHQPELLLKLKKLPKQDVLDYAKQMGHDFTQQDFDDTVWNLEIFLANKLGENFDLKFSLWETMWGKYYLDFVVNNVINCITEQDINVFLTSQGGE